MHINKNCKLLSTHYAFSMMQWLSMSWGYLSHSYREKWMKICQSAWKMIGRNGIRICSMFKCDNAIKNVIKENDRQLVSRSVGGKELQKIKRWNLENHKRNNFHFFLVILIGDAIMWFKRWWEYSDISVMEWTRQSSCCWYTQWICYHMGCWR